MEGECFLQFDGERRNKDRIGCTNNKVLKKLRIKLAFIKVSHNYV